MARTLIGRSNGLSRHTKPAVRRRNGWWTTVRRRHGWASVRRWRWFLRRTSVRRRPVRRRHGWTAVRKWTSKHSTIRRPAVRKWDHNTVADHSTVMGWVDHSLVYSLDSTEDNTEAAHLDILAHILRWEDQNTDRFDDLSELHSC